MSTGLRAGTNNDGYLQVNGTDILTALSSGKIGIGTTPDWASATSTGIELNPAAATNWIGIKNSSASTVTNTAFQVMYGTDTTVSFKNNGDATFSGNIAGTTAGFVGSSAVTGINDGDIGLYVGDANTSGQATAKATISKTGAATFAGDVTAGAATFSGDVSPDADATYDLGSATKRWANIYSADLQLSNEGSANDVDGTWGQYTIQEGEDDLFLINRRSGKKYKFNLTEV